MKNRRGFDKNVIGSAAFVTALLALWPQGCTPAFTSCIATRSCPPEDEAGAGGAPEESDTGGATSGTGQSGGMGAQLGGGSSGGRTDLPTNGGTTSDGNDAGAGAGGELASGGRPSENSSGGATSGGTGASGMGGTGAGGTAAGGRTASGGAASGGAHSGGASSGGKSGSDGASSGGAASGGSGSGGGSSVCVAASNCAMIGAYQWTSCAINHGVAKCWGENGGGRQYATTLGTGQPDLDHSAVALALTSLGANVQVLSTGSQSFHACALVNGAAKCWGSNRNGQLSIVTTDQVAYSPIQIPGLESGVQGIATGGSHACALQNGKVRCWGNNSAGQLGTDGDQSTLVTVPLNGNAESIALGESHSCALVGGAVWCWGSNGLGQLGSNSTPASTSSPVKVVGLPSTVQAIAAGAGQTCALSNGGLFCWGWNGAGQLGDGTTIDRPTPIAVFGLSSGVQAVASGRAHTCAVLNGGARCWGQNTAGQLGNNSTADSASTPADVYGLSSGVLAITAGDSHTCALTSAGVQCWGSNSYGELGNNSTTGSAIPVSVQGL